MCWKCFSCLFIFIFKHQEATGNCNEPSSNIICSSTLLWKPSLHLQAHPSCSCLIKLESEFLSTGAVVSRPHRSPCCRLFSKIMKPDFLIGHCTCESARGNLQSWRLCPGFYQENQGWCWAPWLNYVWTLHKQHKIQQPSCVFKGELKLASPLF